MRKPVVTDIDLGELGSVRKEVIDQAAQFIFSDKQWEAFTEEFLSRAGNFIDGLLQDLVYDSNQEDR
jgi:hypothetical protein